MAEFEYDRWRHGGWYVTNLRYPSGAVGCVSRNYDDRKWRVVCDPRNFTDVEVAYPTRDAAAAGECALIAQQPSEEVQQIDQATDAHALLE